MSEFEHGLAFMQGNAEFGALSPNPKWQVESPPKRAKEGDVLISVRAPVGALNFADQAYGIGRGLAAIRAVNVNSGFLWWWLHTQIERLDAESTGSTFRAISSSNLENLDVPNLSRTEQHLIADFLDRETKRIDELLAEQRGLIETMRERRVELIAQGVTRGIDGGPLGTSPMPWIGVIPQRWTSGRIKHLGEVTLGKMLQPRGREGDIEAPYMRAANVQPDGVVADGEFKTMWFTPGELRSLDLQKGDVVVVEGGVGGYGRAAFLRESLVGWGFQNSINRIRPFGDGRFIAYYLQAVRAKGLMRAYSNIVSMPHLTAEKLKAMPVPIPPDVEQHRISEYLDDQTSRIDALIAESEDLITLSLERRAALITAAVTGQIDVRTAA
ncbi:restriction endonuclease subunit S [Brachybacterium paraconglomeratum]|uniref:restriction endonuclease subunit S n=1 Tax=Brachybacterium paraconglomeratum TaxID=173362 RepID=UPI0031E9BE9A